MSVTQGQAIIIMGVSGSGKTTVGRALAEQLGWNFFEGDDFHPPANLANMADGQPLTDADRQPWLLRLNQLLTDQLTSGNNLVLACSALKQSYRDHLRAGIANQVRYVFLQGEYQLIFERMQGRAGHFMRPAMLQSQLDTLQIPGDALAIDIGQPVEAIVERIAAGLSS